MVTFNILGMGVGVVHVDNNSSINGDTTPKHIVPEWYFLAYYELVKCVPSKNNGILFFVGLILVNIVTNMGVIFVSILLLFIKGSDLQTRLALRIVRSILLIQI